VLVGGFPDFPPQNLELELNFQMGIPRCKDSELPDLNFGQWQRDADVSLVTLGRDAYDFGSLVGNSFSPTEEETHVMGTTSNHEKKVLKAHKQFIQMLRSHKVTEALAMYDSTYNFHFYRLFQGEKSTAKKMPSTTSWRVGRNFSIIILMVCPTNHPPLW
jgi:hypothetical protein